MQHRIGDRRCDGVLQEHLGQHRVRRRLHPPLGLRVLVEPLFARPNHQRFPPQQALHDIAIDGVERPVALGGRQGSEGIGDVAPGDCLAADLRHDHVRAARQLVCHTPSGGQEVGGHLRLGRGRHRRRSGIGGHGRDGQKAGKPNEGPEMRPDSTGPSPN